MCVHRMIYCFSPAIGAGLLPIPVKTLRPFAILIALPAIAAGAQLVLNPGFEILPFPTSWTNNGATSSAGLNATATAARLAYNTTTSLSQTLAAAPAAFTADLSFQIPGNNEAQAFHVLLETSSGAAIDIRTATGGILQVKENGVWKPLYRITDYATFNVPINSTVKLRVIGRNFGTPSANYDLVWSDAGGSTLTHCAAGLNAFASNAVILSALSKVTFSHDVPAGNSFVVDDVTLSDSAYTPPAADYSLSPAPPPPPDKVVNISGVYPHLAVTNTHDECGVGAVVPWAGKLWAITYGPHLPAGGSDKLYEIAPDLSRVIRSESVGGTPANRFIHTASNQLIIGPHFIDANRNVRTLSYSTLPGRYTATAAHLTDPTNRVYMFTMEDGLYDINVNDLTYKIRYPDVQGTGDAFLAGYHGKGAYSGQGLLAVGNNGEPNQTLPSGVLATWNGTTQGTGTTPDRMVSWNQVERIQTCEITGPGGIRGNANPATDPIWTTGFDPEAVILHTLENGTWHTWRLPKASYTHDGAHGWHTEWPRIRQLDPADPNSIYLMHMHGLFYQFPKTFSSTDFSGLTPLCSYYKMPVDYCMFNGRLVMGKNDTTRFSNALVPKAESNLWFGQLSDLQTWGAPTGHGAVWMNEAVTAGQLSDPFLVSGFPQGTLHLRNLGVSSIGIELQTSNGTPAWTTLKSLTLPAGGYLAESVNNLNVQWMRLRAMQASTNLTAFFHLHTPYKHITPASAGSDEFAALADIKDTRSCSDGIIRVMNNTTLKLEYASSRTNSGGAYSTHRYHQIGGDMVLADVADATSESTLRSAAATTQDFGSDAASAWVMEGANKFRLPKLDALYDAPFAAGWARGFREVVTERQILNCHGTFYEVPRSISGGYRKMRALATHGKRITDFASWRGLLVLTGVLDDGPASDKLVKNADGTAALWLGEVDDLWRMGEPRGTGGPWKNTAVSANTASDPYLMYGYDRKELNLSAQDATTITVEVDFLGDDSWSVYQTFNLAAGQSVTHLFPTGFHAHWVRVKSSAATTATAQFTYGPAAVRDRFLDWARAEGLPTGGGRDAIFHDDRDGDGIPAIIEFLIGGDPDAFNMHPVRAGTSHAEFIVREITPEDRITFDVEFSQDLVVWETHPGSMTTSPDQSGVPVGFVRMNVTYPSGHQRSFLRMNAQ